MTAIYAVHTAKALEVIVWLANAKPRIDIYHVIKCAFFADKFHLREYGRPIAGDNYIADTYGPLGLTVYRLLKGNPLELLALGGNGMLPFRVSKPGWTVEADREANVRVLSKSDVEALGEALSAYGDLSFDELMDITHDDPAYRAANGGRMKYEHFLDYDDPEYEMMAEDLSESSRYAVM